MSCWVWLAPILANTAARARDSTATSAGQVAANRAILDRYVEGFNRHDPDEFKDIITTDYIQHNGRAGPGLAGLQSALSGYFKIFPDFHMTAEDSIISADKIVARLTPTATHSQPVQLAPIPRCSRRRATSWSGVQSTSGASTGASSLSTGTGRILPDFRGSYEHREPFGAISRGT